MKTQKKKPADNEETTNGQTNGSSNGASQLDEKIEAMVKRFTEKRADNEVDKYFRALVKLQGSDLHMKVGKAPIIRVDGTLKPCLLYTSPSPRDQRGSRMPSSA